MTVTADGERSRKRLPIAKKALGVITDMGLPVKAGLFEGFFYKVWQLDDGNISGGRVVAPFGIFVLLVDASGVKQFVCDSAECAALPVEALDRYVTVGGLPALPADGEALYAYDQGAGTPVLMDPTTLENPADQWKAPRPVGLPLGGEIVMLHTAYERASGHWVYGVQATHCHSDGTSDSGTPGISFTSKTSDVVDESANNSYRVVPMLVTQGYSDFIRWKTGGLYIASNTYPLVAEYAYIYTPFGITGSGRKFTADEFYTGASATFLAKIRDVANGGVTVRQVAAYFSRTPTDIKGVCVLYPHMSYCTDPAAQTDPTNLCVTQSEIDQWGVTISFASPMTGVQTVDYVTLLPLLQALVAGELAWLFPLGWTGDDALPGFNAVGKLFGWPSESEWTNSPRDTVTFADANGVVYSWLRCCDPNATQRPGQSSGTPGGGFKFQQPEGFVRTPLVMPTEVLTDTTLRPCILLMTATTFHCVADRADGTIGGLYVGSPFGLWSPVTLPANVTMYAIRVTKPADTVLDAGFIGVGKDAVGAHRIYMKVPGGESWVAMSPLPVTGVNDLLATWDVCVFGDDALTSSSQQARQHPVAVQGRRPSLR